MIVLKKENLTKKIVSSVSKLIIIVSLLVVPSLMKAQPIEYKNDQGVLVGTSDSRMFVTVIESVEHVEFQVNVLGELLAGAFFFTMVYDTNMLRLTDHTYSYDIPTSISPHDFGSPVIRLSPSFTNNYPDYSTAVKVHLPIEDGTALGMKTFCTEIGVLSPTAKLVHPKAGEAIYMYSIYYRKVVPGTALSTAHFGYFGQPPASPMRALATPQWVYGAFSIKYVPAQSWQYYLLKPELFTYRSPSDVTTEEASNVQATMATLNATFTRGNFNPTHDITVSQYTEAADTGRLNWDTIAGYGFIYSKTDATILGNQFSDKLIIDGTICNFPDHTEIAAKVFVRGGKTFYIQQLHSNNSPDQTVQFTENLTELTGNTDYFAWSFIQYAFETSNTFLNVGDKITFKTRNSCPQELAYEGGPYTVTSLAGLCWTSNMATRHYDNGDPIPFARAYNCPECQDSTTLAGTFGLLYTWYSAVNVEIGDAAPLLQPVQGICPDGWHIPSQAELDLLNQYSAKDLKSTQYWLTPGNDLFGFNALPAGKYSGEIDRFIDMYGFTGYWASDSTPNQYAHYYSISYYCNDVKNETTLKTDGLSVRCVMNY
jgi:uncharacterized protein (TIGR02145 family)